MTWILFLLIFILLCDYTQIRYFIFSLVSPTVQKSKLKDKDILALIKKRSGLKLKYITVINIDKMLGGMSGTRRNPQMLLSTKLLGELTPEELEYVLLHEAAHYKYSHQYIVAISQILLIIIGIYLSQFLNFGFSLILGITFSIVFLSIARWTERIAENFAAKNMSNSKFMISAVEKFKNNWQKSNKLNFAKLISWNISYNSKRIIANKYINIKQQI